MMPGMEMDLGLAQDLREVAYGAGAGHYAEDHGP